MTVSLLKSILVYSALSAALLAATAHAEIVKLGKLSFLATTNVRMFKFGGEAKEIQAKIERKGTDLSALEIRIPVLQLQTGMEIRDKHMRERIFTAADGSTPDIVFTGKKSICEPTSGTDKTCTVDGTLAFRGQVHPYQLQVVMKGDHDVQGHAAINVLDYGVDPKALTWANIVVDKNAAVDFDMSLQ